MPVGPPSSACTGWRCLFERFRSMLIVRMGLTCPTLRGTSSKPSCMTFAFAFRFFFFSLFRVGTCVVAFSRYFFWFVVRTVCYLLFLFLLLRIFHPSGVCSLLFSIFFFLCYGLSPHCFPCFHLLFVIGGGLPNRAGRCAEEHERGAGSDKRELGRKRGHR